MHELAAVGALVDTVVGSIADHQPCRVDVIRVRRDATFSEEALLQGFAMLSRGTPLDGARLAIEVVDRTVRCACGYSWKVTADDLIGHLWVCPACGHVEDIGEDDGLELIDVTLTRLDAASGSGRR